MESENNTESKMTGYETVQQIAKGSFAPTSLVIHQNKKYVMKKIPLDKQTEKFKRTAHQEVKLMAKLTHPYIVEVKDAWIDKETHLCIVTDYCEGGDMTEVMRKSRGKPFSEEKLCKWMTQLLLAVDYLHSNRLVHGNLKCSNILLSKENDIQLGDFGLAKMLNTEESSSSVMFNRRIVGTPPPNFMCPELLENIPYGYKSDMWSLGCCIFEMAAHQPPFRATDVAGLINKINRSLISPLPIVYSSTLRQIIKTMLRKIPEHRPIAADLLRHPHFQPYLLRCHNPGPVFLPVFPLCSPKDKPRRRLSSSGSTSSKDNGEIDQISETVEDGTMPALLDKNVDSHALKKIDFTNLSPSGSINSDAWSSKYSTTRNLFVLPKKEGLGNDVIPLNGENDANQVRIPEDSIDADLGTCELDSTMHKLTSHHRNNLYDGNSKYLETKSHDLHDEEITVTSPKLDADEHMSTPANVEDFQQLEEIIEVEYRTDEKVQHCSDAREHGEVKETLKHVGEMASKTPKSVSSLSDPSKPRADALESLLELCAQLLKQDKIEELARVLKPFGEEVVSSRETAIWLTKSLINYSSN